MHSSTPLRALLLLCFIQNAYSQASIKSCCSLPRSQLAALRRRNKACPSSSTILNLVDKCQKCAAGTCRVGYICICPGYFLDSSFYQGQCEDSFGVAWPASQRKPDVDWKICRGTPPKTVKPTRKSCCAMRTKELNLIRGWSRKCPSSSTILNLVDKCQKCPIGTCRVGYTCICPEYFLDSSFYQGQCADSFTSAWPVSTRKPDLDFRICRATPPPTIKVSGTSCCAMTTKQLTRIRGWSRQCPSSSTILNLVAKCQKCPIGTCRVGYTCICPEYFLDSSFYQGQCADSFTSNWPVSVRKPDLDFRSCMGKAPKARASLESCCRMTRTALARLRGVSNSCPSSSTILRMSSKCQKCPPGTCRVGYSCICPEYFLGSSFYQGECEDSFGRSWPVAIGRKDLDWRSCFKNGPKGKRSKKSCCKMTRVELTGLRGLTNSCPSTSRIAGLNGKCGTCPAGTCRVGQDCICPDYFLTSSFYQGQCEPSFGFNWPVSIRKKDRDC